MMDKLNSSWQSTDFVHVPDGNFLNHGVYIWVFNFDKIPHLGLSANGKYCSATVRSAQILEPTDKFFRWIKTKNQLTFFIGISGQTLSENWFESFHNAILENETCLNPIKKALGYEDEKIQTLADFIPVLERDNKVIQYATNQYIAQIYLLHYTKDDVLEMIEKKKNYALRK